MRSLLMKKTVIGVLCAVGGLSSCANQTNQTSHSTPNTDSLDSILACYAQPDKPGLGIILSQSGKTVYQAAVGMADITTKTPLNVDQLFEIGSVTKQFTAAAILLLQQQGKLSVNDRLHQYLPNFPHHRDKITLAHLLSHTSGLADYLDNAQTMAQTDKKQSSAFIVEQVSLDLPIALPGVQYQYSNTGYLLLGRVIEVVSGLSYADFMQQKVFTPLGLTHTQVNTQSNTWQTLANKVTGYSREQKAPTQYIAPQQVDRSWIGAAGAIVSTLADMSRWHQALKGGKLVNEQAYRRMVTPYTLSSGEAIRYGFGFDIYPINGQSTISHQGMVPGYFSWSVYYPKKDVYAMVYSNDDTTHPGPAALHMVSQQLGLLPQGKSKVLNAEQAAVYTGQYHYNNGDIRTIGFENGQLTSQYNQHPKRIVTVKDHHKMVMDCYDDYLEFSTNAEGKKQLQTVSLFAGQTDLAVMN